MKKWNITVAVAAALLLVSTLGFAKDGKTYKHASEYQLAILDQNLRVYTGSDATLAKTETDAKLGAGGQGIHLLHTDAGDYHVEAPVNKGMSFLSAMASNARNPAVVYHNKWFLDNVQSGTKVLFASECAKPSKNIPTTRSAVPSGSLIPIVPTTNMKRSETSRPMQPTMEAIRRRPQTRFVEPAS